MTRLHRLVLMLGYELFVLNNSFFISNVVCEALKKNKKITRIMTLYGSFFFFASPYQEQGRKLFEIIHSRRLRIVSDNDYLKSTI